MSARQRALPVAAIVFALIAGGGLGVLACAVLALRLDGVESVPAWKVLAAGAPAAAVSAAAAAYLAARWARTVRMLRADAMRRLHDPTTPATSSADRVVSMWTGSELTELARTLDALHLRVRMSDEVAERHRRTAETASAGMFELLSGLVEAEEGARGQLSAELHDTVAQSLMAARARLGDGGADNGVAAELMEEAEDQLRAVMARTRPPALRDGDLARAIIGLRDDMHHRYGLTVSIRWPGEAYPLPLVTAVTVYRFFQEALLNVVKHADVEEARAELLVDGDHVVAVVSDEGPGFDPDRVHSEAGRHVGLGLLRERSRLVGGCLEVVSWPSNGTTLRLRLPRAAAAGPGLVPIQRPSVA